MPRFAVPSIGARGLNVRLLIGLLLSILAEPTGGTPPSLAGRLAWLAGILALVAAGGLVAEMVLTRRARLGARPQELARWQSRAGAIYGAVWIAAYALFLLVGRWSDVVAAGVPVSWWLPTRLLLLAPMLLIFLAATWGSFLMVAVVRRAMAAQGPPHAAAAFTLRAYLGFQLRQQLLILLIPYVFIFAARDLTVWRIGLRAETPALLAGVLAVYILSPLMFRYVWPTEPLPPGKLREQLERIARRSGTGVSGIFVWRTGGIMVNACMTGVARPLRYVFLTDTLVREFHPAQVDAIFGHELGHARYWHMPFYMLMALGSMLILALAAPALVRLPGRPELLALLIIVPYWGLFFGYMSRRFEWQCDLLGARLVACPGEHDATACSTHRPESKADEDDICPYQAWAFTSALARIAALGGVAPSARSWRHGSISHRILRVNQLINRPGDVRRFDHRLWTFKVYFFLGLALLGILVYFGERAGWFRGR